MARIGPYEIVKTLGKGGMGEVFLVQDPAIDRRLALKLIHPGRSSEASLARFMREAHALARIKHPGVVTIHDVGQAPEGHYLVMDYVEGQVLSEAIPLAPERAARVAAALADALEVIHGEGLLHRDLKPENVILREDDEPVLLDFGLVSAEEEDLTKTGQILGTPYAMSPEQASGQRELSPAVDVWGLGVVLFMSLSGRPPFEGQNLVEVILAIGRQDPRWPKAPAPLLSILRRCMQKEAAERYSSAAALAEDLRRYLRGEAPQGGVRRALPTTRLKAAAALLASGLLLGWLLTLARADSTPHPRDPGPGSADSASSSSRSADEALARLDEACGPEQLRLASQWLRAHPSEPASRRVHALLLGGRGLPPSRVEDPLPERNVVTPFLVGGRLLLGGRQVYAWAPSGLGEGRDIGEGNVLDLVGGPAGWLAVSVFLGEKGGELRLVDPEGRVRTLGGLGPAPMRGLASREDRLVSGDALGRVRVFSWRALQKGEESPEYELPAQGSAIGDVALSVDGLTLAVTSGQDVSMSVDQGSPDNRLTVWDLSRPRMPRKSYTKVLPGEGGRVALSLDGRLAVVSVYWVNELHVYDLEAGRLLHRLRGELAGAPQTVMGGYVAGEHRAHASGINAVAFLPSGLVASAGGGESGGELRVWDPVEGKELVHLMKLPRALRGLVVWEGRLYSSSTTGEGGKLVSWELVPR